MSDILEHHGIKGMKWGVIRTPAQLGHVTGKKAETGRKADDKNAVDKIEEKKTSGKASKSVRVMSDDELRQRISRLNMEEQYDNLVARQKQRDTGVVKKLLAEAAENLGRKALGIAVDKLIDKITNKKFDINDWKDADIDALDADTIQKVSAWYKNAQSIKTIRKSLNSDSSVSEKGKKDDSSSKEADSPKANKSESSPQNASNSEPASSAKDHSEIASGKVPWAYRKSGADAVKEKERVERKNYKHDKKQYKWLG